MYNQLQQQYEQIILPSKGKLYQKGTAISSGKIKLRYPTAEDQNILLSKNLLAKGKALDTFIQKLILDDCDKNSLLIGDKNAIIYASRFLAYGKNYQCKITCPNCGKKSNVVVDVSTITQKQLHDDIENKTDNQNLFTFVLPSNNKIVKFNLMTTKIANQIQRKIQLFQKTNTNADNNMTLRLSQQIVQFDGKTKQNQIRNQVNKMRSIDSLALRSYINELTPDIDSRFDFQCTFCNNSEKLDIEMNESFFWPNRVV